MTRLMMMAAALTALVALTLATVVQAQCTAGDIKVTKTFPLGNLSRSDPSRASAIINFMLPSGIQYTGTGGWVKGIPQGSATQTFWPMMVWAPTPP